MKMPETPKPNWLASTCKGCGSQELKGCNCAHCGRLRFIKGPESQYIKH